MSPAYDFRCEYCGAVTEIEESLPPQCTVDGETMIRIWTTTPVHFKGSGFYSTGG